MKSTLNIATVVGFGVIAVTYILDRSACLGIPDWVVPLLTTLQLGLAWLAKSPFGKQET